MTYHTVNMILSLFCVIAIISHCVISVITKIVDRLFKLNGRLDSEELNKRLTILSSILLADIIIPALV